MDDKTLDKANELRSKRRQLEAVLSCFEWSKELGGGTTNPSLIIEYDGGDDRETKAVPILLGPVMIDIIKNEIKGQIDRLDAEYRKL